MWFRSLRVGVSSAGPRPRHLGSAHGSQVQRQQVKLPKDLGRVAGVHVLAASRRVSTFKRPSWCGTSYENVYAARTSSSSTVDVTCLISLLTDS